MEFINPILTVVVAETTYYGTVEELRQLSISEELIYNSYLDAKKAQLATNRWEKESGGTTWNNFPVKTDHESQSKVTAAFLMTTQSLWVDGSVWKFADGLSRPVTTSQMQQIAIAVMTHVQSTFEQESTIITQLQNAVDLDALIAISIDM